MSPLLKLSTLIDRISDLFGKITMWLVLAAVLISTGNAVVRKAFNVSSNAWLEIQWYLFAAVFMLGSGYVLLRNAHVRIDFLSTRLSKRVNAIVDIVGFIVVVLPLCALLIKLSWPLLVDAWVSGEVSQNAGGLIRWPVYSLLPLGFAILLLQAGSELIKRLAFLTGHRAEMFSHAEDKTAEEKLAEALILASQQQQKNQAKAPR